MPIINENAKNVQVIIPKDGVTNNNRQSNKDGKINGHLAVQSPLNPPAPSHLPESMIKSVKQLPNTQERLILFTRHSLRERSNGNGFSSADLPLTPKGKVLAKAWGRWLSNHLPYSMDTDSIASPIGRCVMTAELMQEGAGISRPVVHEGLLVEPGSLVVDAEQANNTFKKIGALNFINAFLNNELTSTKRAHHGGLDILQLLYNVQPAHGHLTLAVSHDTLLAAFLGVVLQLNSITWDDWPKMMEGVFLWFDDKPFVDATVSLVWRGKQYHKKVADLTPILGS